MIPVEHYQSAREPRLKKGLFIYSRGGHSPVQGYLPLTSLLLFLLPGDSHSAHVPGEAEPSSCGGGADGLGLSSPQNLSPQSQRLVQGMACTKQAGINRENVS